MSPVRTRTLQHILIAYGLAFVTFGSVHPLFGFSTAAMTVAMLLIAGVSLVVIWAEGISLRALGASGATLPAGIGLFAVALGLREMGLLDALFLPQTYLPWLRGAAQTLLFQGVLFVCLARCFDRGRLPWRAWLVTALLASLFHLPLALWTGAVGRPLILHLAVPLAVALVLTPLYLVSRNLWLVALVHGALAAPLPTSLQALLVLIPILLILSRFLGRSPEPLPLAYPVTATARRPVLVQPAKRANPA